ncbi:protein phosphatase 2C domain-containing protein [Actinokineospora sp. NBRC 105648]|uniref:protein phosphatase 2C domain-containing protein n=1 Tax=Actinokineospora sp. NBRC 105648 TaxID=3032206 RepID=UPI0024A51688|nr:protein phosphatase 2C domain-containing protein [Actinokineospora sp. NBRC 105648]GLZ43593.1 hypothetical protein Acsp05_72170 [Actinokineospora sp. NBRC 105648]
MDVEPSKTVQGARIWHHTAPRFVALSVWTERIAGRGEDADPLVVVHWPTARGLIAVFDGVGGAGRASAGSTPTGQERTQAWVAPRRLRGLVEEWFVDGSSVDALHDRVVTRLAADITVRSRMRGRIHREFPSTLAALAFTMHPDGVRWDVVWAGDSRCYVVEPDRGLQQLSLDDVDGSDALDLLLQDPPMTNMVSVDREFALNRWRGHAPAPCVLVTATDGFFGYVSTPAQFEHVLLDTLWHARDPAHWGELLAERVAGYTGDDASLAVVALGFHDFGDLRVSFGSRRNLLRHEHDEPLRAAADRGTDAVHTARSDSWRKYRGGYEQRLATTVGEDNR